jgi:hypothetical protein
MTATTPPVTSTPYTTIMSCYCDECVGKLPHMLTTYHATQAAARRHGIDLARDGHRVEMYRGHITKGNQERLVATITRTSEWCEAPRDYRGAVTVARLVREDLRAARAVGALVLPAPVRLSVRKDSTHTQGVVVDLTNPDRWANGADRSISDQARAAGRVITETFRAHTDGYTWLEAMVDSMYIGIVSPGQTSR